MRFAAILLMLLFPAPLLAEDAPDAQKLAPVKHIIVFYLENHSFDNLMGTFPGADGIANAGEKSVQTLPGQAAQQAVPHHRLRAAQR